MSEQYPHLVFHNMKTQLGQRVTSILKYLFPVPKEDSKRVITFANHDDFISFRHHTYQKGPEGKGIELKEAGPRFQLRCKKLKLHNNFILLNLFNFVISLLQCTIWSWGRLITLMLPILNGHTDRTWILRRSEDFSPMTMAGKHKYVNQLIKGLIWIMK